MSTLGFLTRKTVGPAPQTAAAPAALPDNSLDIDEELFSALGTQMGGENEAVRNLLLDVTYKVGELDTVKEAIAKLIDPVGRALRAFETEKAEKVALQSTLNTTRNELNGLRSEFTALGKKATVSDGECRQLRQELTAAQQSVRTLEGARAELSVETATARAQMLELERKLAQEIGEARRLRDDNRRLDERLVNTDRRIVAIESDLNSARQKLAMTEDEKRTLQGSLDKTIGEAARLSRRLMEAENTLSATQTRLRQVEAQYNEANTERQRAAAALEEANERHESELITQRTRYEALASRAAASDKLMIEAREQLMARAEEIRTFDRRMSETAMARDTMETRLAETEAARIERDAAIQNLEQVRGELLERSATIARTMQAKETALTRAEETMRALTDRVSALETELAASRDLAAQQVADLQATLQREKLERAVVEGALETGRKDFSRLMREVMALQRHRAAQEPEPELRAANAA